jgi:hypothetical protein
MSSSSLRTFATGVLMLLLTAPLAWAEEHPCLTSQALNGAWSQGGDAIKILFTADRVVLRQNGAVRAATILRHEPCKLIVRDQGIISTWSISGDDRALRLKWDKETIALSPLPSAPPELDLTPLVLPAPQQLPPERVKAISAELLERTKRDQAVINDPAGSPRTAAVIAENLHYLKDLVLQLGWIDIPRFGKPAAAAAILIAKHGDYLPLMEAALPIVERDAKENGGSGEMLSVLVDGVLITLGRKQKYGTQITEDAQGRPYILPVEDPGKVDDFRKAIGILSWADYIKLASKNLYDGAPIRMPGPDE